MNRREAIAALTSIPGLARIQKAEVKPNDVIVCELDGLCHHETRMLIEQHLTRVWPGHKIVVCERGMRLKVMSST